MTSQARNPSLLRPPIIVERVRRIDGQGFSFIPHRFVRDGFFASLTRDERSLYLLLVLVGDRNGVSFYHYDTLCSLLTMPLETYLDARNALIRKDLIAFDGTRFQVLSLPQKSAAPPRPLTTAQDMEENDPATIAHILDQSFSHHHGDPREP